MEEILASIRRIISEDDAPGAEAEAAPPAPEPEPAPQPVAAAPTPEPEPTSAPQPAEEEVLELTERVETHGDIDVYPSEPPATSPAFDPEPSPIAGLAPPEPEPEPAPAFAETVPAALVGTAAATAAASAFGKLTAAVAMPKDGQTLDGVVRELLRPLLKEWLDEHLPAIVQAAVAEEVERIARTRGR